jgi:hypothetical protein
MVNRIIVTVLLAWTAIGCSGGAGSADKVNPDDYVQKKIDAMMKLAEIVEGGNVNNGAMDALESYRGVPFEAEKQVEAAKTILAIYKTRIANKLKGEIAYDIAGEMAILERAIPKQ